MKNTEYQRRHRQKKKEAAVETRDISSSSSSEDDDFEPELSESGSSSGQEPFQAPTAPDVGLALEVPDPSAEPPAQGESSVEPTTADEAMECETPGPSIEPPAVQESCLEPTISEVGLGLEVAGPSESTEPSTPRTQKTLWNVTSMVKSTIKKKTKSSEEYAQVRSNSSKDYLISHKTVIKMCP